MHSDQTRKDGSSESMIQALYYDFVARQTDRGRVELPRWGSLTLAPINK